MNKSRFYPLIIPIFGFCLVIACSAGSTSSAVDGPALGIGGDHATGEQGANDPQMGPVERPAVSVDSDPTTGCDCNSKDPQPAICEQTCADFHNPSGVVNLGTAGGGKIYQVQGSGQVVNSEPAVPVTMLPPEYDKVTGIKVNYTQPVLLNVLLQAAHSDSKSDDDSGSNSNSNSDPKP